MAVAQQPLPDLEALREAFLGQHVQFLLEQRQPDGVQRGCDIGMVLRVVVIPSDAKRLLVGFECTAVILQVVLHQAHVAQARRLVDVVHAAFALLPLSLSSSPTLLPVQIAAVALILLLLLLLLQLLLPFLDFGKLVLITSIRSLDGSHPRVQQQCLPVILLLLVYVSDVDHGHHRVRVARPEHDALDLQPLAVMPHRLVVHAQFVADVADFVQYARNFRMERAQTRARGPQGLF
mmetsp:Transcript_11949/g.34539  ORF Transcript_11949/g.34539 Transcript_11949/m.34539 type:complete len:235 (-) Transcript_11949:2114-2818(-)